MEPDGYLAAVNRFADDLNKTDEACDRYMSGLKGKCALAEESVTFRLSISTDAERADVEWRLEFGLFPDDDVERRKAWWLLTNDVQQVASRRGLEQACRRYEQNQPLFVGATRLFEKIRTRGEGGSPDYELIDDRAVTCIADTEIYRVGPGYSKLLPLLNSRIAVWARSAFPDAPRFLRLDPWKFYIDQPMPELAKVALVRANPKWMKTLAIFPGIKEFAAYELQDCTEDENERTEYRLYGPRKLEVTAQRREAQYLSMMIEELPRGDDQAGVMVARCIHLDTRAAVGTPMADARLQHLDLAINVYLDDDRTRRMSGTLQTGRVQDATFRTHLLRVENVPFPALFGFAEMFLTSSHLRSEWLADLGLAQETR